MNVIDVVLQNPGQYFACCGLLELANCIDPEAKGYFQNSQFHLSMDIDKLINHLAECNIYNVDINDKSSPLIFGNPFNFHIHWWKTYTDIKSTWSGNQHVFDMTKKLQAHLGGCLKEYFKFECNESGFCFDSAIGRKSTDLDRGYSQNKVNEKQKQKCRPLIELSALVGLQRFRPKSTVNSFVYGTWKIPMPSILASLATCDIMKQDRKFEFEFVKRSPGKNANYYSTFPAKEIF